VIRSVCCVCGRIYGTKPDGRSDVRDSHGYCERCFDETMLNIKSQFAELPADGACGRAA
jgi:hypothetical protein